MRQVRAQSLLVVLAIVGAVALAPFTRAAPSGTQGTVQPQFRARTEVVSVPVTVRSKGALVKGLTARDFILFDSGVEQTVERVDDEAVPIDLTLVLDTSGSTDNVIEQLKRDAAEVHAMLRPTDRIRLLTIDTYATQVMAFQGAAAPLRLDGVTRSGLSSVHDAIGAALLHQAPLDRRHLISVMTDGIDSISALPARTVADLARRSDAVLNLFLVDTESAPIQRAIFQCVQMGLCSRTARYWLPYQDREFRALAEAAEVTGGERRDQGMFRNRSAVAMFRDTLDDFRQSYVLRYSPRNVTREGWRPIEVRVQGQRSYTIRARHGYGTTMAPRSEPAPSRTRPAGPPTTAPGLVSAFDRGEFASLESGFTAAKDVAGLVRAFRAGGNPWPALPHREAVFVLELADAAMYSRQRDARLEAMRLLQWYRTLVRHPLEPTNFEQAWYWTEIAMLAGIINGRELAPAVENALSRFPNEPRFLLARAVAADQLWPRGTNDNPEDGVASALPAEADPERTVALYEAAAAAPAVRFEARIRQGYLLFRLGRHEEAAARLDVQETNDNELLYLHRLVKGKVLEALGRLEDADAAYRGALAAWPGAQSARVALMTLAMRRGNKTEAEALAEAIETQPANAFDPMWRYWQGDARFYTTIRAILRQAVR